MNLKENFENAVNEYITAFTRKHDTVFIGWTGYNAFGETAGFYGDYFFNLDDIRKCIDSNAPKGLIFQWHDDYMKYDLLPRINFGSYLIGARWEK